MPCVVKWDEGADAIKTLAGFDTKREANGYERERAKRWRRMSRFKT
jgi:hypothetical protein